MWRRCVGCVEPAEQRVGVLRRTVEIRSAKVQNTVGPVDGVCGFHVGPQLSGESRDQVPAMSRLELARKGDTGLRLSACP